MIDQRRYSIIPFRSLNLVKRGQTWRTLASLCAHTSRNGICYPNQLTLSELCNLDQGNISRSIRELYDLGLLRYLEPIGKPLPGSVQRGNRYQILYEVDAPLPHPLEREIPPGSRTGRW